CFVVVELLHSAVDVMIAEMQHAEAESGRFLSDIGADTDPADHQPRPPGDVRFERLALGRVAEEPRPRRIVLEQRRDRVVRSNLLPADARGPNIGLVDGPAVAKLGKVAWRPAKDFEKGRLEVIAG